MHDEGPQSSKLDIWHSTLPDAYCATESFVRAINDFIEISMKISDERLCQAEYPNLDTLRKILVYSRYMPASAHSWYRRVAEPIMVGPSSVQLLFKILQLMFRTSHTHIDLDISTSVLRELDRCVSLTYGVCHPLRLMLKTFMHRRAQGYQLVTDQSRTSGMLDGHLYAARQIRQRE